MRTKERRNHALLLIQDPHCFPGPLQATDTPLPGNAKSTLTAPDQNVWLAVIRRL